MKFLTLICLFTMPLYASTMTIKRCSKVSIPIVKRFLGENFLKSRQKWSPKWCYFGEMGSRY